MPALLYAHLTWTTRERREVIDVNGAEFLRRFLPVAARRHGASVVATGIVSNHVHLLLLLDPVVDIPRLVQGLKGASARIANRDRVIKHAKLRWANGYDLRSVSPRDVPRVTAYLEAQVRRHPHLAVKHATEPPR